MTGKELDQTDIAILQLLQKNADISHRELALKVHKAVATIHERVKRLKETGYIKRTVAILDRKLINRNLIAFSQVLLSDHTHETLGNFEREVAKFPEVMECFQMTGSFDFILDTVSADHDMNMYLGLLRTNGVHIVVGVPAPYAIHPFSLIGGRKSLCLKQKKGLWQ